MIKAALEKKRKYSFLLIIAVCVLFLSLLFVTYRFSAVRTAAYFVADSGDMALLSASPCNKSGVSEDSPIVITWNHEVSVNAAEEAEITPSVRGTWSTYGNKLVFTPQHLAAGTYYTVFIPAGTTLNSNGDVLKDDVCFSFETENSDLRIPDTKSFSVGSSQYNFSEKDSVAIPVSCIAASDFDVNVTVYRAENSDAFIHSLAGLFVYPDWAQLSIGQYQGSLRNFHQISETAMAVQQVNNTSAVVLGSLPAGQYLVRMSAAGSSYDVAVTVSDMDCTSFYDGSNLNLWCHQSGDSVAGGSVRIDGKKYALDANGFVALPYTVDPEAIARDPSLLAVTVFSGDNAEEYVYFVSMDQLNVSYRATMALNKTNFVPGDDLTVSGAIDTAWGGFDDDGVTLALCSGDNVLETKTVKTENGCFSYTWDALTLADGDYRVKLLYQGESWAEDAFQVDTVGAELKLAVSASAEAISDGGSVSYTVTVEDSRGATVENAVVALNNAESKSVNGNGVAVFNVKYDVSTELPAIVKNAAFTVTSPYGTADAVTAAVTVITGRSFIELSEKNNVIHAGVYHYEIDDNVLVKEKDADNKILIAVTKDGKTVAGDVSPEKTASYNFTWEPSEDGAYTVSASAGSVTSVLQQKLSGLNAKVLSLLREDGSYRVTGEGETPSYAIRYEKGAYAAANGSPLSVDAPAGLTSQNGKNIVVNGTINGGSLQMTVVSLYKGMLPPAAAGKDVFGEGCGYSGSGELEESRVFFGDASFSAAFAAENRDGNYFIRIWSRSVDGATVSRCLPVSISGVALSGAYEDWFAAGSPVDLGFRVQTASELNYTLTLNDDLVFTGSCDGDFTVATDISAVGNYSGTLVLSDGKNVVATLSVAFGVYQAEPVFYEVSAGYDKNAKLVYEVNQNDDAAVAKLFELTLSAGDQIHQQIMKTLFYSALGDNASYLVQDIDDNLLPLQNSDGGFGRYDGAESDLFLSVLVSEERDFTYDKASLQSYLSYRLSTATDADTASLACWGLCQYGLDCTSSMKELAGDHNLSQRGELYLAESYLAAGDRNNAEKIYRRLQNKLSNDGDKQYLTDADEQGAIVNTALMLDLALKMDREEKDALLSYLMDADIQSQTGRYLLELAILRMVDTDGITLATSDKASAGHSFLSLKGSDQKLDALASKFYVDEKEVSSVRVGDIMKMEINWEDKENSIYLIYIMSGGNLDLIQKNGIKTEQGHLEFITAENSASFDLKAKHAGDISCFVYVINLTTGEAVGYANASGIEVKE